MSFISVVILTYNHERCIKKCLDSLLESRTEDVELIVVDDASKDKTVDIVGAWFSEHQEQFESVKLLVSNVNKGTVKNLIKGVEASSSFYIKDIAGDDWFLPNAIDKIKHFCSHNENFGAVFSPCAIAYEDSEGGVQLSEKYENASLDPNFWNKDKLSQLKVLCRINCLRSPGAFYTREFWDCLHLDNYGVVLVEDWAMWLRGIVCNQRCVEMNTPIVVYCQSSVSVSKNYSSQNYDRYLNDCVQIIKKISLNISELPIIDKLYLVYMYCYINIFLILPVGLRAFLAKLRSNKNRKKRGYYADKYK